MPICTPNKVLYIVLHAHYYTVARHPLTTTWSPPPYKQGESAMRNIYTVNLYYLASTTFNAA